jgi:hypothetical protein
MRNEHKGWWFAILQALAGAHPQACWGDDEQKAYQEREAMKTAASKELKGKSPGHHEAFRAQWWLLWAYSHWWRAREGLDKMSEEEYDQAFETGMDFRRYLAAWLWSVGVPQLSMTANDLQAVHQCTGVGPMPHPLLPRGYSEFLTSIFQTTKIDSLPAKNLDQASILLAWADS